MALYSKREFSENCGIETKVLAVYIKRGKVVVSAEDKIDTDIPQNSAFMSSQALKVRTPKGEKTAAGEKKSPERGKKTKVDPKIEERFDLESTKKTTEIKKMEREIQLQEMKMRKLTGEVIPTAAVKALFAQHFKSVTMTIKNSSDLMLMDLGKKLRLNRNELAEIRNAITVMINKAISDGIDESKKIVPSIVAEYSQNK